MARRLDPRDNTLLAEWDREMIRQASPRTLDELLSRDPSFSLYRRQTALFGNPTSAGVSLRNTGATAASRTLVLLDGIPQNDPFGGWVYWARYDPATIDSVRIVPASKAVVWGNQSPAGVVQLSGREPFQELHVLRTIGGSDGLYGGSTVQEFTNAAQTLGVLFSASALHSDGFFGVAESQRGSIDRRLDLDLGSADLKFAWKPVAGITIEPTISYYEEERGNGSPLARNSTEALDLSLRVSAEDPVLSWQALAYYQNRDFESGFSSINSTRTGETPSLDQFSVPATGIGGALTFLWKPQADWSITSGADVRYIEGETNENASFIAGQFTREREAGGTQGFTGVFAAASHELNEETRLDASLRADVWWLRDGRRIEDSLLTGANLRNDRQEDREGIEPSFAVSASHDLTDEIEAHVSAGTSFRLPTLNELHRPFRVRNDVVEANPSLDPERFFSLESGVQWQSDTSLKLRGSLFYHWIKDAIANVPVTDASEIAALFGTIPAGGSGSQRQNVDEAQVFGVQSGIEWQANDQLTLGFDGIYTKTEFTSSSRQPLLEGKPFPQAPDLRLIGRGEWQVTKSIAFSASYEYGASQFDDALAQRRIADYTSASLGLVWKPLDQMTYQVRVDNLFDQEIQTGSSSDGIRSIAGPRSLLVSAEWDF